MKLSMKSIAAAALLTAYGVATAQVQTFLPGDEFNGLTASGSATLAFSTGLLEALDTGQIEITGFALRSWTCSSLMASTPASPHPRQAQPSH